MNIYSYSSLIWDGDFTIVKILGQTAKIQNFVKSKTTRPIDLKFSQK